jgi:hypothetical protein
MYQQRGSRHSMRQIAAMSVFKEEIDMPLTVEKEQRYLYSHPENGPWLSDMTGAYFTCQRKLATDLNVVHEHIYGREGAPETGCRWCKATIDRNKILYAKFKTTS